MTWSLASGAGPPVVSIEDLSDAIAKLIFWCRVLSSQKRPPGDGSFVSLSDDYMRQSLRVYRLVLNLPLSGMSFCLVAIFLRVRTPPGTVMEKLRKVDWM